MNRAPSAPAGEATTFGGTLAKYAAERDLQTGRLARLEQKRRKLIDA